MLLYNYINNMYSFIYLLLFKNLEFKIYNN